MTQQTVGARESRAIAEAARETEWQQAELRQGIVPGPAATGSDSSASTPHPAGQGARRRVPGPTAGVPRDRGRRRGDRARVAHTGRAHQGAQGSRRPRHAGARGVRRPGPVQAVLHPSAATGRLGQPGARRAAVGAPVDRCAAADQAVRYARAEEALPAPLRAHRHQRVPAHRTGRRQRPGALADGGRADRRRVGLHPQRRQAVVHQRRDRRPAGRHGEGAQVRRTQGRHHGVRRRGGRAGHHGGEPQRVPRPARHREQRHPFPRRARARGERHRA